jgi:transcriptional regulator with XRE-family HTH domain
VKSIKDHCVDIIVDLKKIRESKGITTAQMEVLTGIRQPNITRLETLNYLPSLQTVIKYAEALNVEIKLISKE